MTVSATARVPTRHASKYLQQLCKHWQHNLAVAFTADHGTVTFPPDARWADWPGDALVRFDPATDALPVRIDASLRGPRQAPAGPLARPLAPFPFRAATSRSHSPRLGSKQLAPFH